MGKIGSALGLMPKRNGAVSLKLKVARIRFSATEVGAILKMRLNGAANSKAIAVVVRTAPKKCKRKATRKRPPKKRKRKTTRRLIGRTRLSRRNMTRKQRRKPLERQRRKRPRRQ